MFSRDINVIDIAIDRCGILYLIGKVQTKNHNSLINI